MGRRSTWHISQLLLTLVRVFKKTRQIGEKTQSQQKTYSKNDARFLVRDTDFYGQVCHRESFYRSRYTGELRVLHTSMKNTIDAICYTHIYSEADCKTSSSRCRVILQYTWCFNLAQLAIYQPHCCIVLVLTNLHRIRFQVLYYWGEFN